MKYFLFEKYTLTTRLTVREARERLETQLEPGRNWPFLSRNATQPYIGNVENENFTIRRALVWNNPWQPVINGRFQNDQPGAILSIRMQPHILPLIFLAVWTFFITCLLIGFLNSLSPVMSVVPLGMLIFAYMAIIRTFNRETAITKAFLTTIFQ